MRVESPSSPREGCSVSTGIRLVMWVRSPRNFVKFKSKSRILGDVNSIPSGGGVPEGRWGSVTPMSEGGNSECDEDFKKLSLRPFEGRRRGDLTGVKMKKFQYP